MAKRDPQIAAHLEWIGFVRPTGLVVSAPALVKAGVILNRHDREGQRLLKECVIGEDDQHLSLPDFEAFAKTVLGWNFSPKGYAGTAEVPIPDDLQVPVPESGEVLAPDFAVRSGPLKRLQVPAMPVGRPDEEPSQWQILITICDPCQDLDGGISGGRGLEMSPHGRMERLLRQTNVTAGLLFNGTTLRLISAPRGENSGWMDFQVRDMVQTAGRPICSAMRALLSQTRLLSVPRDKRLNALLDDSRKFQNEVSERLAEQVLHSLYELLRGFQAAHDASKGELLRQPLAEDPDEVYRGLLTVVLRLVYLLYTEERDMLPQDETFLDAYSPSSLYERLRADAALYPDTMDQRYGAYAQMLALWRMVHDGAKAPEMWLAPRYGDLFHPDRYPFLEGRSQEPRQVVERIEPPLVGDGTVYRVLEKLIVLDGERISYRALDVEHIGSVYETMMGFRLERATGQSIAIKAATRHGAPTTLDLEVLLNEAPRSRAKWIRDGTDRKLTAKVSKAARIANTVDEMHAALASVIDRNATPDLVQFGNMVLQPSQERRRSGSHYTPRELTEPIVRKALEPIMARLRDEAGGPPHAEQILDLKVCDPAMGSGAFLVEACRQLADALIAAWRAYDTMPEIPPEEDETIFARRQIAQRCLYGVDRNPKAVDLAKLSLWLTTLAKDHPLTFLDHALCYGDSLVGPSIRMLQSFHWKGNIKAFEAGFEALKVRSHLEQAGELRQLIREADNTVTDWELRDLLEQSRRETHSVRLLGDLLLAAFFRESTPTARESRRKKIADKVLAGSSDEYRTYLAEWRHSDPSFVTFHWQIEFPEVFDRANPGFDCIVGNPPFLGGKKISTVYGTEYRDWLGVLHKGSNRNADLVSHFFRRSFDLVRQSGTVGLIASNTISQGDTRSSGLGWICRSGGDIYEARRRVQWPGLAAVIVSVVHIGKGFNRLDRYLDGQPVEKITAFLFHGGGHDDPTRLVSNVGKSYIGCYLRGMGFTFDDKSNSEVAAPLSVKDELIRKDSRNAEHIAPFIGGEEVNSNPTHSHHRYVIDFGDAPLRREHLGQEWTDADAGLRDEWLRDGIVPLDYPHAVAADWPDLLQVVEQRVRPYRARLSNSTANNVHKRKWWVFANTRPRLREAISGLDRVLVICCSASPYAAFTFLPTGRVYAHSIAVFPMATYAAFSLLQARTHEFWARLIGSTLKDDLRYTPSKCFETFPLPQDWENLLGLEGSGEKYYEFRANLMVRNGEGLTKTYNRFHDPYESDAEIVELRRLHTAMDRVVLNAYGWADVPTDCEFLLDYEIDEESWGRKRKPYRYRWPDDVRDEVLARLLELNAERAAEEARARND